MCDAFSHLSSHNAPIAVYTFTPIQLAIPIAGLNIDGKLAPRFTTVLLFFTASDSFDMIWHILWHHIFCLLGIVLSLADSFFFFVAFQLIYFRKISILYIDRTSWLTKITNFVALWNFNMRVNGKILKCARSWKQLIIEWNGRKCGTLGTIYSAYM